MLELSATATARNQGGFDALALRETQEMLDFCAERGIVSEVEVIPMQRIDEAYARMLRSDVRYRFVVDMSSLGG